jgi:lysophospholipase L1-like esterase
MIDIVKGRNPLRFGNPFKSRRIKTILEFNDWINQYGQENGLAVLDLEKAVRYRGSNRFLREDLARIDGLHLNSKAYKILDGIVLPTLETVDWDRKGKKK